jgi:PhnB protein
MHDVAHPITNQQTGATMAVTEEHRSEYSGVHPYICVDGASAAIEFYRKVLGATELYRIDDPSGKVGHAELSIGATKLMIADEYPEMGFLGPRTLGGTPVTLHAYVDDVDAVADRAVGNGATMLRPVEDQFYGDRGGKFEDPFGHIWWIATHKEDLSIEEMKRRAAELYGTGAE